eukprot:Skav212404  [mRNA]  locus=scaffold469:102193:104720:+ [translate_table: standard]
MITRKFANLLPVAVGTEANAAVQITSKLRRALEHDSLAVLFQHVLRNTALEIGLHQVVEEQDTEYPVDSNADEVKEAVSPNGSSEVRLLWVQAENEGYQRYRSQPSVVEKEQRLLNAKGVAVNVQQSAGHQLRSWLIPSLNEETSCANPKIRPRDCTDNSSEAEQTQKKIRVLL